MPLEFTAFGDFFYRFSRPDEDGFYIGAIELDASLSLSHWVNVATAIAFNGADDEFGLGAFVIDCGIFGQGDRRFTAGGGVEVFPHGEVRAVYEQSVDSDARRVVHQLVGGSTFQPTGLRR